MSVLVITVLGLSLVWLSKNGVLFAPRSVGAQDLSSVRIPDDLWEAFNATITSDTGSGHAGGGAALATATGRRTTVGGLHAGQTGWIAIGAIAVDDSGQLWVDAAAVVQPHPRPEYTNIRRNGSHYEVRDPGKLLDRLGSATPARTSVRIHSLYS